METKKTTMRKMAMRTVMAARGVVCLLATGATGVGIGIGVGGARPTDAATVAASAFLPPLPIESMHDVQTFDLPRLDHPPFFGTRMMVASSRRSDVRYGRTVSALRMSSSSSSSAEVGYGMPTDLPDSLDDAAEIAATACAALAASSGPMSRCRVDFDTSVGDETYTTLKSSTEFMQKFTSALSYALVPGLMERRQQEMMRAAQARAELRSLMEAEEGDKQGDESSLTKSRRLELERILAEGGRDLNDEHGAKWSGPTVRVYFPDEGSAALARRDWKVDAPPDQALVPPCVEFSSCGGVQLRNITSDMIVLFFCPRASEADFVEKILYRHEETCGENLVLTVFVNPLLVDMGVTGFGMAGRMLRERLIDPLVPAYYLRTLSWGALTRVWPKQFTVWQEDADEADGYRMIKSMDRLPSNPEVEDIYDIENGRMNDPEANKGFGFLNGLGDFVNGMTRL